MIFGGNGINSRPKTVELFNWETREHCKLGDLPFGVAAHSGTVLNGIPVFCGGFLDSSSQSRLCHKYNLQKQEWDQVDKSLSIC